MLGKPRIYIAIATFFPWVGGAEKQALAQARSLHERGYAVTIITFRHDRTWLPNEVIEGIPVSRVAGRLLGDRKKLPRFLQKLFYLIAMVVMGWVLWRCRQSYDVLHVHQLNLLALPVALLCRFISKPMLIVVHSAGLDMSTRSSNKASLVAGPLDATASWLHVEGPTGVGGDLADLERLGKPVARFTRWLLNRTQTVVVIISSRMKSYLAAHDFQVSNIQLIPNGVDITRFNPCRAGNPIDEQNQIVVCVSRLSYEKGIDVLLQAWYQVHKQLPQAKLIIVGPGLLQSQLEHMAKALGIAESVEFAGFQSDIPAQFRRGGLAVLPSRVEGMPVALLEAMACGLPCVATCVSGSEDIIQHGVNGLLVEPEDYESMAEALLALLRDPLLAKKYGDAARRRIEQHYSLEHITDMYVELYQRIAGCRSQAKDQRECSSI